MPSIAATTTPSLLRVEMDTAGADNFSQRLTGLPLLIAPILPSLPTIKILPSPVHKPVQAKATGGHFNKCLSITQNVLKYKYVSANKLIWKDIFTEDPGQELRQIPCPEQDTRWLDYSTSLVVSQKSRSKRYSLQEEFFYIVPRSWALNSDPWIETLRSGVR